VVAGLLFAATARLGHFAEIGYLAIAIIFVVMSVFVIRNLAFTTTIDHDVDQGGHREWWASLSPPQKWASYLAFFLGCLLSLSILAAAILG
jgi:hypothetical protein